MATKKAASNTSRTAKKPAVTTTKVTTVKAVSRPSTAAAVAASPVRKTFAHTSLVAAVVAEFIGTFMLGAGVIASQGQPVLILFILTGIVLALGGLSGAYVNPALTVGAWVTKRISAARALTYIVAQFLGGILALVILSAFVNASDPQSAASLYSQTPTLFKIAGIPLHKEWFVFFAELVGALIFGFAVASATRETRNRAAAALTVGIGLFLGLVISGSAAAFAGGSTVLNPAVALSVQALQFSGWAIAVYLLASVIGAVAGFVLYDLLRKAQRVDD